MENAFIIVGNSYCILTVLWYFGWFKRLRSANVINCHIIVASHQNELKMCLSLFCFYCKNVQTTNEIIAELNYCLDFIFGSNGDFFSILSFPGKFYSWHNMLWRILLYADLRCESQNQQQQPTVNEPEVLHLKIDENTHVAHLHTMSVASRLCFSFEFLMRIIKLTHWFNFTQCTGIHYHWGFSEIWCR